MITIIIDVFGRRFINTNSIILQELEWHFHGALFLLSLGFTYMKDAHVRVDVLRENLNPHTNRIIEFIGCLFFLLPYCCVVIYFGVDFTLKSYLTGEISAAAEGLRYRFIIKSCLPIGFLLLGISGVAILLKRENKDV
jgi:TRAP-type mannitol/chloroaromatic compound transport system permease small subunit